MLIRFCFQPNSSLTSPIITLAIGPSERLFAAHASILSTSPFFAAIARGTYLESSSQRILLPEETPEVFSSVLEYLYKGDYYPKLLHNKRLDVWQLEDQDKDYPMDGSGGPSTAENGTTVVWHEAAQQILLKDTLVYCTAERYGLDELKRLALRKQGLQSGIQVGTILASARYAYANTPDSDSKLRAHYLALIIRSRGVFKRSGTMQMEMEAGGSLWFDLFVAMCNHMVCPPHCFLQPPSRNSVPAPSISSVPCAFHILQSKQAASQPANSVSQDDITAATTTKSPRTPLPSPFKKSPHSFTYKNSPRSFNKMI